MTDVDGIDWADAEDNVLMEMALQSLPDPIFHVCVYMVDKRYGGPEEGGWWYEVGVPCLEHGVPLPRFTTDPIAAERMADDMTRKIAKLGLNKGRRSISSVLSTGQYMVRVEEGWPKPYPETRPYYE